MEMATLIMLLVLAVGVHAQQEQALVVDADAQRAISTFDQRDASDRPQRCKRSVAPIVGMPCEAGFKPVGDDCVMVNVEFE